MKPKKLIALEAVLDDIDVEFIRMLGQSMRSTAGGYGFDAASDIDKSPEEAVKEWAQMICEGVKASFHHAWNWWRSSMKSSEKPPVLSV